MSQTYHLRCAGSLLPPTKRQREKLQAFIEALPTALPSPDGGAAIGWARLDWAPDGLSVEVREQNEVPPTDLTHLIWYALEIGLGLSVGEPEDHDEWETDAIAMVFGFRPDKTTKAGPLLEAELIERPRTKVIPVLPPAGLRMTLLGPNWEELQARSTALDACDGKITKPFTLWVTDQADLLVITPNEFAAVVAQGYFFKVGEPIALPSHARPILTGRADGTLVRLWREVPRGRRPVQSIKYEWGRWRWENRPYKLID